MPAVLATPFLYEANAAQTLLNKCAVLRWSCSRFGVARSTTLTTIGAA